MKLYESLDVCFSPSERMISDIRNKKTKKKNFFRSLKKKKIIFWYNAGLRSVRQEWIKIVSVRRARRRATSRLSVR